MADPSPLERAFETYRLWNASDLPAPVTEYVFARPRRFRFDFAWPRHKLAVELEGGTRSNGRHVRSAGYATDCEKYNLAVLAGWRVLRYTSDMLHADGGQQCFADIRQALGVQHE